MFADILSPGLVMFPVGLVLSLWAAWAGRWRAFAAAYGTSCAMVALSYVFPYTGPHGTHGSTGNMLAWGLVWMAPIMVVACFATGVIAFLLALRL